MQARSNVFITVTSDQAVNYYMIKKCRSKVHNVNCMDYGGRLIDYKEEEMIHIDVPAKTLDTFKFQVPTSNLQITIPVN